jgi:hypothetical protein
MKPILRYDKDIITNIIKNNINCKLSEEVINIINILTEKVGDPEYIKTPLFEKNERNEKSFNKFKKKNEFDNWNINRNFETTDIKKKQGIEQYIDIIRKYLNKMTEKTFLTSREKIIETLDLVIKIATPDELNKISDNIFNIVSGNIFYSVMYASLYQELLNKYSFLVEKFTSSISNYKEIILNIKYVDSNKDYDKFCENNKVNENNRALLLFYVNLMKEEFIEKEKILNMLSFIYEKFFELIEEDNKKGEIEEISEILYLLVKNSYEKINECNNWNNIYSNIEYISKLKSKEKVSITNKAVFKHMDILDEIN